MCYNQSLFNCLIWRRRKFVLSINPHISIILDYGLCSLHFFHLPPSYLYLSLFVSVSLPFSVLLSVCVTLTLCLCLCLCLSLSLPPQRLCTLQNVNCRDVEGRQSTPLHFAAGYNRLAVVELLLQHGADVHAKDKGWEGEGEGEREREREGLWHVWRALKRREM